MRIDSLSVIRLVPAAFLLACFTFAGQNKATPTIPQTFPPPEPDRPHLQLDQPPTVVHGDHRAAPNAAQARQDADELAKLAQSIPGDVDKVSKGQLPTDLAARLKRIEKLSKQLRRDLAQ
jgi:hypothetical protein